MEKTRRKRKMNEAQLLSIVLNFVLAIAATVFAKEYRKFKGAFAATAEAIQDDRVTWDEAKEILEGARP